MEHITFQFNDLQTMFHCIICSNICEVNNRGLFTFDLVNYPSTYAVAGYFCDVTCEKRFHDFIRDKYDTKNSCHHCSSPCDADYRLIVSSCYTVTSNKYSIITMLCYFCSLNCALHTRDDLMGYLSSRESFSDSCQ